MGQIDGVREAFKWASFTAKNLSEKDMLTQLFARRRKPESSFCCCREKTETFDFQRNVQAQLFSKLLKSILHITSLQAQILISFKEIWTLMETLRQNPPTPQLLPYYKLIVLESLEVSWYCWALHYVGKVWTKINRIWKIKICSSTSSNYRFFGTFLHFSLFFGFYIVICVQKINFPQIFSPFNSF